MNERSSFAKSSSARTGALAFAYVSVGILAAVALRASAQRLEPPDWSKFAVLLLLACVSTRLRLNLPGLARPVSLSFPFCFAAITEFSPLFALGLVVAVDLFETVLSPSNPTADTPARSTMAAVFRWAVAAVAVWAADSVYGSFSSGDGLSWAIGSVAAAAAYFAVMSTLRSIDYAVHEGANPIAVWNRTYFWTSPIYLLAPFGVLVAKLLLEAESFLDTAVGLSVIAAAYWYLQLYFPRLYEEQDHAQKLAEIRQRALETLVVAIEAKDGSTAGHLERVKRMALRLGDAIGCTADELRTLRLAAVLHDVGKVGVPDYILQKPSRLTDREFQEIAAHAGIGANIVSAMDFPEPVDEVVLSHHEHWDGEGYPRGLKGEEIPRLARILTVVDCFDALVSERPYRHAMPIDGALEMLRRQRGRIFDPEILDAFLELAPGFSAELRAELSAEASALRQVPPSLVNVKQTWVERDPTPVSPTAESLQRIGRRPVYLETLHRIMTALGKDLNYASAFESSVEELVAVTGAVAGGLFVIQPRTSELSRIAGRNLPEAWGETIAGEHAEWLVEKARSLEEPSILEGSLTAEGRSDDGSMLLVPLALGDRLVGALALSSDQPNAFDAEQAHLTSLLRPKLASTVVASQQLRQLHIDANTDAVTGLPNSRVAFQRLEQEINRAQRSGQELGVLFMDLNGLKPVNDSYGHIAGDRLLAAAASILRQSLRSYDFVGRVGGDEFLGLMPGISRENMEKAVVEIKQALRDSPVELAESTFVRPLLSIGAALYPADATTAKDLLDLSDQRMYADKQHGLTVPVRDLRPAAGAR